MTPTAVPCSVYTLTGFDHTNNDVQWMLNNGGPTAVTIVEIEVTWGTPTGNLTKIKFDGSDIWNVGASPPSASITGLSSILGQSESKELKFTFQNPVLGATFNIIVHLDPGGCAPESGTEVAS
jgi:hypothetical protein